MHSTFFCELLLNLSRSGNPSRTAGLYFGGPLFMGNNPRQGNSDNINRELSFLTALGGNHFNESHFLLFKDVLPHHKYIKWLRYDAP